MVMSIFEGEYFLIWGDISLFGNDVMVLLKT